MCVEIAAFNINLYLLASSYTDTATLYFSVWAYRLCLLLYSLKEEILETRCSFPLCYNNQFKMENNFHFLDPKYFTGKVSTILGASRDNIN